MFLRHKHKLNWHNLFFYSSFQVWITNDCTQGFSCNSKVAGGGRSLSCFEGEVLNIDISAYTWDCVQDTGHCPSTGGFVLGACDGSLDGTTEVSTTEDGQPEPTTDTTESTTDDGSDGNDGSEKILSGTLLAVVLVVNAL